MSIITILGEGAWGTAIATLLAHNGYQVNLWCYHKQLAQEINQTHVNSRFLPDIKLDPKIKATTDLKAAIDQSDWIFEAIPVQYLRSIVKQAAPYCDEQKKWVVLSKGIEQNTLLFPSEIIAQECNTDKIAVFAGPSFALDVARKQITAVTVAARDQELGSALQAMLANDYFRPYLSSDIIGVQAGAALKNVITLAIGMLDGAEYTDNAKAFVLTRGLCEMAHLITAVGGDRQTVYGLSGVGDLVLTAMGQLSRNLQVGRRLGKDESLKDILERTGYIPEGINSVQSVHQLIEREKLDLPICTGVYDIIFNQKKLADLLQELMAQPLSCE